MFHGSPVGLITVEWSEARYVIFWPDAFDNLAMEPVAPVDQAASLVKFVLFTTLRADKELS